MVHCLRSIEKPQAKWAVLPSGNCKLQTKHLWNAASIVSVSSKKITMEILDMPTGSNSTMRNVSPEHASKSDPPSMRAPVSLQATLPRFDGADVLIVSGCLVL